VSLELTFDDASDAAVRREWDALLAAGLPSQAQHRGASNRPHVTMLVRTSLGPIDGSGLDAMLPLDLTLGAPILFGVGRSRVIARSVVPSAPLLHLHAAVHSRVGAPAGDDHTAPGAWTPHVTLARRVPLERLGDALAVLAGAGGGEVPARATCLRRWDAEPRTITHIAGHGTLESC